MDTNIYYKINTGSVRRKSNKVLYRTARLHSSNSRSIAHKPQNDHKHKHKHTQFVHRCESCLCSSRENAKFFCTKHRVIECFESICLDGLNRLRATLITINLFAFEFSSVHQRRCRRFVPFILRLLSRHSSNNSLVRRCLLHSFLFVYDRYTYNFEHFA